MNDGLYHHARILLDALKFVHTHCHGETGSGLSDFVLQYGGTHLSEKELDETLDYLEEQLAVGDYIQRRCDDY